MKLTFMWPFVEEVADLCRGDVIHVTVSDVDFLDRYLMMMM